MRWAIVVALAACGRVDHVASCDDDLHGVWHAPDGAWLMIDNRVTLEAYPMQPDATSAPLPAGSDWVVAPRVLDLERNDHALTGVMRRRFMRRSTTCDARATVRVTTCRNDMLELVTSAIATPIDVAPCRWSSPQQAHVERWTRD